jgi:Yip1 domain
MTEENSSEWQAPPPPESPREEVDPPQMSEISTVANIFIEPENTFKDLKQKPRFIIAGIIIALLVGAFTIGIGIKMGDEGMRNFIEEQINKSSQADGMSSEQKSKAIDLQMTIGKYSRFAVPVFVFISFFIGGLLYWLGAKAFGGTGSFFQNLSVWVYSGLPPAIVAMVANLIVLFLKPAEQIDLAVSQKGVLQANPGFFLDGKKMPMIVTVLSTLDVFAIWGWILAAIGLRTVNKLSKGSAWGIVLIFVFVGLLFRLLFAALSGNPQ